MTDVITSFTDPEARYAIGNPLPSSVPLVASVPLVLSIPANSAIERLEARLLQEPQVDCPIKHSFAPGVYMREIFMPAGSFIIGHEHRTEHLNVIRTGRASVMMDGIIHQLKAGDTILSQPGVRKVLYIHEDMSWATIHPIEREPGKALSESDLDWLEEVLIVKSESYLEHLKDYEQLKLKVEQLEDQ